MLTAAEQRVMDRNAEYFGVSILGLMEAAGRGIAEVARSEFSIAGKRVVVACGTGNNGGDGLVAARHLKGEARVSVLLAKGARGVATPEARANLEKLGPGVDVVDGPTDSERAFRDADLIVDALLGIGVHGEIREPYATLIREMNKSGKPILSVDVPSGFDATPTVRATVTAALIDAKEGMTEATAGRVRVVDIGFPREVMEFVGPGEFLYYPVPRPDSHKGQNGRLLVVGGGPFTGAPAFVGLAAYRIGVDAVHVATPSIAFEPVAGYSPNLIVHPLPGARFLKTDVGTILEIASGMDAVVIGPGLGASDPTKDAIRILVRSLNLPVVLDADALTAAGEDLSCLAGKRGIVTPHHREFEVLSGTTLPPDLPAIVEPVKAFAKKIGFTVLLKGSPDVITDGASFRKNKVHNVAMTVGGTGDALAGICGGLLSKRVAPFIAARMAAFANGYAGNLAFEERSYGMMTTDLIEKIPRVLKDFVP
ncbi:MAG: NAD(P)H-hydrate dehydratase [Methanobacteriota archaeon]|nr:MAG: NAD(P)H-hydrate dehydratase [Euryarchaeota archaeon]